MAKFEKEIDHLILKEGGSKMTDRKHDAGGLTKFGITRPIAKKYGYKVRELDITKAKFIYRMEFWDKLNLTDLKSQKIAGKVFDIAVNCGRSAGGKYLQKALNVLNKEGKSWKELKVDGKIGKNSIAVVNGASKSTYYMEKNIVKLLNILQGYKYYSLALNPKRRDEMNINGWLNNRID